MEENIQKKRKSSKLEWCQDIPPSFSKLITYLILLKEGAADVAVKRVREVVVEVLQTRLKDLRLLGVLDREDEQVDEPGERVLVHGLNVGQIGNAEEQDGAVDGDRLVTHTG